MYGFISAEHLRFRRPFEKKKLSLFWQQHIYFQKVWLMKETDLSESPAIKVLLRWLRSMMNLSTLNTGFHQGAFLEIVNILKFFAK